MIFLANIFPNFLSRNSSALYYIESSHRIALGFILVLGVLQAYRVLFLIISFFGKGRKYPSHEHNKKYGVLVAAKNESAVIRNLIDSIKKQTYNPELITIFIIADNCDDNTAQIARDLGCVVYERFHETNKTKGFALESLMQQMKDEYPITSFDGFFIFDADNLIPRNFVEKMHDAFCCGNDAVLSYRNIKNFNTNIISATYGIHFYRNHFVSHRPRSILNTSTTFAGTGYLVDSEVLKDGWKWVSLDEGSEHTLYMVTNNKRIAFCEEAEVYDEQPTDFKTMIRQRLRWSRGQLEAFMLNWKSLIKSFIKKPTFAKYDLFFHLAPIPVLSFAFGLIFQITTTIYFLATTGEVNWMSTFMGHIIALGTSWLLALITGIFVMIRERKHLRYKLHTIIWYLIWWPLFDVISPIIQFLVCFRRVKWTQIVHDDSSSIEDIEEETKNKV